MARESAEQRRRLLEVTPGNIRHNHLYVRSLYDFFPPDCIGPPRKSKGTEGREIEIHLDGLNETISTDIGANAKTGKPRGFFRGRRWVRKFFEFHKVSAGSLLALERIGARRYRLSLEQNGAKRRFSAAEFFSGIGLVRLALEAQGWQVAFANDIDEDKAQMYRHNWSEEDHLRVEDIHKLDVSEIPTCDLFTASFPCNDLSIAGRWEGLSGKESSAFWGFIDILQKLGKRRPPFVLLENVVGFLLSDGGRDFEKALLALNELGYGVDAVILNAVHWTPQSRARLFVIGGPRASRARQPFAVECDARPDALAKFIYAHPDICWHIRSVPPLPKPTARLSDIIDDLPPNDPHWWSEERVEYFMNQMSPRHRAEAERMIGGKTYTYATAFRRVRHGQSMAELRTDGIAGCLRTPRGGSGRQILFKAGRGKYQVRLLTARECARLQGVPDSYIIDVPLNQALFGFGDAVCVPAVEWIVREHIFPWISIQPPANESAQVQRGKAKAC